MNTGRTAWLLCTQLAIGAGLMAPAASAKGVGSLTEAVPDDVYLCISGRENPERKFLDEYWGDVFAALKASGVGSDIMNLIGSYLGDEDKAEMDRITALAKELVDAVRWSELAGKEMAFAQRMPAPKKHGDDITMGTSDMLWLFRGTEESAARNFDGMMTILNTVVGEVNKAVEDAAVAVQTSENFGATIASISAQGMCVEEMPVTLSIARHGDVIAIAVGHKLLLESLSLLEGKGEKTPISKNPRYVAAFKPLPEAEDTKTFFDMQALLGPIAHLMTLAEKDMAKSASDVITNARMSKEGNEFNRQAIEAYENMDYPKALELIRKAHEAAPEDSLIMYNVACFESLNGNKDVALSWLERSVDAGFYAPKQISGDNDLKSLRGDARYEVALKKATEMAALKADTKDDAKAKLAFAQRILNLPAMLDYVAVVEYTEGYAVHADTVVALAAGAKDEPLYRVLASADPLTKYERFLPKEAVSFDVSQGIDFSALYGFLEDLVRSIGAEGEELLAKWAGLQQQIGFDVRRDVLSWLDGEFVSVETATGIGTDSVMMIKVKDEAVARQKVTSALDFVSGKLQELSTQNPMLGMLAVRTSPCTHEKLAGFQNVAMGMSPQSGVLGVKDGYLMFGTSANAVALVLATAAGEHPNVTANEQVMKEAVVPRGEFSSVTFSDKRKLGQEIGHVIGVVSMAGGMAVMGIPDPETQKLVGKLMQIINKLGPVATKIDFYQSTASCTTFDGTSWRVRQVTNYKEPETKTAANGL